MKKLIALLAISLLSCARNPITHRVELNLVPDSEVLTLSATNYKDFLNQHKMSTDAKSTELVKRVGTNISAAVDSYLRSHNLAKEADKFKWEFHLVEDPQVNAWCMPGGKVVVYTGILPFTQNENGLAVVLGHEISHAVAKHGNERMSQGLLTQLGGTALQVALSTKPAFTQNLFYAAYGAGTEVGVLLPFSRNEESEADHMGLIFMSMAGYDPHKAIDFWQRMVARTGSNSTPTYMSDHPADKTRIEKLQQELPEALTYYKK